MLLVIDTTILFAGVLRDSTTRKILLTTPIEFIVPDYVFQELDEHIEDICMRNKLSKEANEEIISILRDHVVILRAEDCIKMLDEATELMRDIDPNDAPILATALSINCDGIWSEDPHLQKQTHIKTWRTKDLLHFLR
ncbi:MAG: PIN domain-containing protein [Candidatus Thermoplasmatota archaeon]